MSYSSTVLADGAVGYWRLGEGSSGSAMADATGNGSGGYQNTGGVSVSQAGIAGAGGDTAVAFSSTGYGYSGTAGGSQYTIADTFSFEAWVKRSATQGSDQTIFGAHQASAHKLRFDTGNTVSLLVKNGSTCCVSTNTITDTTTFHHIVVTKSGASFHLYIDGTDVTSSVSNPTFPSATSWDVGSSFSQNTMQGTLDEVALYPSVLSSGTVSTHYALGNVAFLERRNLLVPPLAVSRAALR